MCEVVCVLLCTCDLCIHFLVQYLIVTRHEIVNEYYFFICVHWLEVWYVYCSVNVICAYIIHFI